MSTVEAIRVYQTISENSQKAAELKAYKLLEEVDQLSATDKEELRAVGKRLATKSFLEEETRWYALQ